MVIIGKVAVIQYLGKRALKHIRVFIKVFNPKIHKILPLNLVNGLIESLTLVLC